MDLKCRTCTRVSDVSWADSAAALDADRDGPACEYCGGTDWERVTP